MTRREVPPLHPLSFRMSGTRSRYGHRFPDRTAPVDEVHGAVLDRATRRLFPDHARDHRGGTKTPLPHLSSSPEFIAKVVFGALDEMATNWVVSHNNYPLTAIVDPVMDILLNGMRAAMPRPERRIKTLVDLTARRVTAGKKICSTTSVTARGTRSLRTNSVERRALGSRALRSWCARGGSCRTALGESTGMDNRRSRLHSTRGGRCADPCDSGTKAGRLYPRGLRNRGHFHIESRTIPTNAAGSCSTNCRLICVRSSYSDSARTAIRASEPR